MSKNYEKKYIFDDVLYASVINVLDVPSGLEFYTDDEQFIQVGSWNYPKDKKLDLHYHLEFPRTGYKTNESVLVIKGKMICNLYTDSNEFLTEIRISENQLITQFNGAHEYIMIEDLIAIEIKNGPYFGPEKDRKRIEPKKD